MANKIVSGFAWFGRRVGAFLKDPLLELTLEREIADMPRYDKQVIYRMVKVVSTVSGLYVALVVPADPISRIAFGLMAAAFVGLAILYGIWLGRIIARALGAQISHLDYASVVVHEIPIGVFVGVLCSIANAVSVSTGFLPILIFSCLIEMVPLYRVLLLSGVQKRSAGIATVAIFGFFFALGLMYGAAAVSRMPVVPPYAAVGVDVDGASVLVEAGQ